jgi:hypothetical protein
MRDLPNPSLIDTPYSPEKVEMPPPSWRLIALVAVLFVAGSLFLDWMRFYYD